MSSNWPIKLVVTDGALLMWTIKGLSDPFYEYSPKFSARFNKEMMFCLHFKVEQNKTRVMLHSNTAGQNSVLPIRYRISITRNEYLPAYQEQVHSQEFEFKRMEICSNGECYDDYIAFDICKQYVEDYDNRHNTMTIVCSVDILEEVPDVTAADMMDLSDSFGSLFKSATLSDMTLSAGGKNFAVHKNILAARSPVFEAMLKECKGSKGVKGGRIVIEDMSSEVCEEMLNHIYTGRIPSNTSKYIFDLFVAADKYQLKTLKTSCETTLIKQLDIDSVSRVLMFADGCKALQLKTKCIGFIINNSDEVMNTEGWKQIEAKHDLLVELFGHLSREIRHNFSNKRLKHE